MAKPKKEFNPNQVKRRKRKPIFYIICEGEETEINYFKHFRSRNCLVEVKPVVSKYKAAEHLVKSARKAIGHSEYRPMDGDELWCVFDCDDNSDKALTQAKSTAKSMGYKVAFSNPCFEYWYLLHFKDHKSYLASAADTIQILKGEMGKYAKNQDVFEMLLPFQGLACERADKRLKRLEESGIDFLSRGSNPATNVYQLVRYLNEKK